VRAASKTIKCTVSWNHLIDWQLSKGKINGAIRIYNEVCRMW
jgi:pentatricopeptide repeat protein